MWKGRVHEMDHGRTDGRTDACWVRRKAGWEACEDLWAEKGLAGLAAAERWESVLRGGS